LPVPVLVGYDRGRHCSSFCVARISRFRRRRFDEMSERALCEAAKFSQNQGINRWSRRGRNFCVHTRCNRSDQMIIMPGAVSAEEAWQKNMGCYRPFEICRPANGSCVFVGSRSLIPRAPADSSQGRSPHGAELQYPFGYQRAVAGELDSGFRVALADR